MQPILPRRAFPGTWIDRQARGGAFVGQAIFDGCVICCTRPRQEVAGLLPPSLELAVNDSLTPDVHPLVFILGEQRAGATIVGGRSVPLGVCYGELALAIPFVRHVGGIHLHTWIPAMVSGHGPATWSGNLLYGFNKRMGRVRREGPFLLVTDADGTMLLNATVEPRGEWTPAPGCTHPCLEFVRDIFDMPVVGKRADGAWTCSYFGWDFASACVRPADACVSIDRPLVPGLTPGDYHDATAGTFEVEALRWRLTWPMPCRA